MTTHSTPAAAPTSRISGPGELLQAVPYLLGFHPAASLVLVGLSAGRLVVTARLDLAEAAADGVIVQTLEALHRGGSEQLVVALYDNDTVPGTDGAELPWREVIAQVDAVAGKLRCRVLEALLVCRGRWWSYQCDVAECCPAQGRPLPEAPSAFAAAATVSGVVALADRAALEALLDPLADDVRHRLDQAISVAENRAVAAVLDDTSNRSRRLVKRALFAAARSSREPQWQAPSDDDVARFGVALSEIVQRDAVWTAVDDGRLRGRELWRDLARRLPSPYDAAPLFLFGWEAWRSGDGALASIAAERAIASDPHYSAADLLLAALSRGIDPRRLPKLRLPRSA